MVIDRSRLGAAAKVQALLAVGTWVVFAAPSAVRDPTTLLWTGVEFPVVVMLFGVLLVPTFLVSGLLDQTRSTSSLAIGIGGMCLLWAAFGALVLGGADRVSPFLLFAVEGIGYSAGYLWLRRHKLAASRDIPQP